MIGVRQPCERCPEPATLIVDLVPLCPKHAREAVEKSKAPAR